VAHQHQLWSSSVYPLFAYAIAVIGSALGLACANRLNAVGLRKGTGWLTLGAISLGSGIWGMHFVAMLGYSIDTVTLHYDVTLTALSWIVAVVVVGIGMLVAGSRRSWPSLLTGGLLAGLGVAGMHYLGMAAVRMPGDMSYDSSVVVLSVVVAIAAATAALWATLRVKGVLPISAASLVMGLAVGGMHYTGMLAVTPEVVGIGSSADGVTAMTFMVPLVAGLSLVVLVATFAVLMNPVEETIRRAAVDF
jgi:NO-binding membrane sensor protein with MHYT domain